MDARTISIWNPAGFFLSCANHYLNHATIGPIQCLRLNLSVANESVSWINGSTLCPGWNNALRKIIGCRNNKRKLCWIFIFILCYKQCYVQFHINLQTSSVGDISPILQNKLNLGEVIFFCRSESRWRFSHGLHFPWIQKQDS